MSTTMPKETAKQAAFNFFLKHAAYSYNPATETKSQGRARTARRLAKAEADAKGLGFTFEWTDDWSCGSHIEEYGEESYPEEPTTCETCICKSFHGEVLASLSCIDDADAAYRRVVEAELALEALAN